MPRIKRRTKAKKIVRKKNSKDIQMQELTEDQLRSIPPYLLDRIPAQASLRPSAQTLRAMMMQRLAPPYVQMPNNQQQQQAQNLKNSNDLKEQMILETKRAVESEMERKYALKKKEAKNKLEANQKLHEVQIEEQELEHQVQNDKVLKQIEERLQQLELQKGNLDQSSEIYQQKQELSNAEATVHQAKLENANLKSEYEANKNRLAYEKLEDEYTELTRKNQALQTAIEKANSSEYIEQLQQMANNIAEERTKQVLIARLKEENDKVLQQRLQNLMAPTPELLQQTIDGNKEAINQIQEAYVKEDQAKAVIERSLNQNKQLEQILADKKLALDRLSLENTELTKRLQLQPTKTQKQEIEKDISEMVKAEREKSLAEDKLKYKTQLQETEREHAVIQNNLKLLEDENYKSHLKDVQFLNQLAEQTKILNEQEKKMYKAQQDAILAHTQHAAELIKNNAIIENKDPLEELEKHIDESSESDRFNQLRTMTASYLQEAALHQSQSVQENETTEKWKKMLDLQKSSGPAGNFFRHATAKYFESPDFTSVIAPTDHEKVRDFYRDAVEAFSTTPADQQPQDYIPPLEDDE